MAGLSFHVSESGMTVVAFMPSWAHAEPTNASTAAEKRAVFTGFLPCLKAYTRAPTVVDLSRMSSQMPRGTPIPTAVEVWVGAYEGVDCGTKNRTKSARRPQQIELRPTTAYALAHVVMEPQASWATGDSTCRSD